MKQAEAEVVPSSSLFEVGVGVEVQIWVKVKVGVEVEAILLFLVGGWGGVVG